ncbi:MAG: hypothetical protein HDR12_03415 [Lachnospiraceae bacterium]|nr:hypothetical protein [Lachnospiraceae bacterium]
MKKGIIVGFTGMLLLVFFIGYIMIHSEKADNVLLPKLEGMLENNFFENVGRIEYINLINAEIVDSVDIYDTLNSNIFGKDMLSWFSNETKQKIEDYAESVKGDFIEVWKEDSIVPKGLVIELENMIYQSLDSSVNRYNWEEIQQSIYFETMKNLGEEKYHPDMEEMKRLFPELNDAGLNLDSVYDAYRKVYGEYCFDLFHIPTPDSDNYVFATSLGGTAGICEIYLTKLVNGEFETISYFETQNAGYGSVIQYEGEFYYIFLQNNYNLKIYDGVRIYKLGENMAYENLQIKYLPYDFVWKNLYNTSEGKKWDSYVKSIQEEITSDEYLDNGTDGSGWKVYFGDEEEVVEEFIVPENEKRYSVNEYYKIDFTNTGIPIYMRKSSFEPSNTDSVWHLQSRFYIRNQQDDSIVTLQNMELNSAIPNSKNPVLVQMWFKEMEGKVYTFCLYHVSDYNYMLNVVRLEGNEVNRIRTDILSPQRHFVLTEGERFFY